MADFIFPFPGRELAEQELSYDLCYRKIPEEDRGVIVERAWQKGCRAAREVYEKYGGSTDFKKIIEDSGLTIIEKDVDYVTGGRRYFSDYISGQKTVTLYLGSVQMWADSNSLDLMTAENLILSHEYFHYLEMNGIGQVSKEYQVPMIKLGPLKIGRTGIHALSEIGAHAFARTYYELAKRKEEPKNGEHIEL